MNRLPPRPILADVLVKEALRLELASGSAIREQWMGFLVEVAVLYREAQERGELSDEFDGRDAVLVFGAIYMMALLQGLGSELFDVDARVGLVERLLELHLKGLGYDSRPLGAAAGDKVYEDEA